MSDAPQPKLLRLTEVTELTGLSAGTVFAAIAAKAFPRFIWINGIRLWKTQDVIQWKSSCDDVLMSPNNTKIQDSTNVHQAC